MGSQVWKVSAKWASKRIMCNAEGITRGCGARCCKGNTYWPPRTGGERGVCPRLGPAGCTFTAADKPVICHLYPLMLNKTRTLVLHNRAILPHGCCSPCYKVGEPIIAYLEKNFAELFGADQAARVVRSVLAGWDTWLEAPAAVVAQLEVEERMAARDELPLPRSLYVLI